MKILVAGDVCPTASTEKFLVNGDLSAAFGDVRSVSTGADAFLINLECALTAAETAIRKYGPNLKAAPECAQALRGFGVTDAGLANNHIYMIMDARDISIRFAHWRKRESDIQALA